MKVNTWRLQNRLMLLILLMVVPLLAASVQNGFTQRKVLMSQVEAQSLELLGYIESAVRIGLRRTLETVEMFVLEGEELDLDTKQRALDKMAARTSNRLNVAIADTEGKILASSIKDSDFLSTIGTGLVQEALRTGQISLTAYQPSHAGAGAGIAVAYPMLNPECDVTKLVIALIHEELLVAPISNLDLPDDISLELADLDWNVVARYSASDKALGLTEGYDLGDIRQKLAFSIDGELIGISRWEDGVERMVGVKTVRDYRGAPAFYVATTKPVASDLTRATVLAFYQVAIMLVIALIVMPIGWGLMNEQLVEPIGRLMTMAERFGSGHMDARHGEPYDKGEVGELAKAFDDMADALKERTEELEYTSYHDNLTGAYNRAYIETVGEGLASEENLPTTVISGDINGLKIVNDTYGHQAGNELIACIGEIIQECVGEAGIVARWGGDEFIAILPNTGMRDGLLVCNKIRSACEAAEGYPFKPSVALGVATRMAAEQSMVDTLVSAESRMYRNKFIDTASARGTLLYSLRKALSESTHETEEHSSRMRLLALELGKMIGLSSNTLDDLAILASLHDIGKIGIPDSILQKAGPLTDEEWRVMKAHPEIGARIVGGSHELAHISESILAHHERWDGAGYPDGLKEEEIPLISRILAIVDAYDAMTSDRPYRKAMSRDEALAEIQRCSGSQFDPDLVEAFLRMMEEIARSEKDEMEWLAAGMQWYEGLSEGGLPSSDMPEDEV